MKQKKEPLLLVNKIKKTSIYDAPEPLALIVKEREEEDRYPFPLTRDQQFALLYLLRTKKSGIITREELQNIIFAAPTLH
tara:strand:- start:936 stop:1175 length:240 start_codon:yes stop_codon:yes gene_type:complete